MIPGEPIKIRQLPDETHHVIEATLEDGRVFKFVYYSFGVAGPALFPIVANEQRLPVDWRLVRDEVQKIFEAENPVEA